MRNKFENSKNAYDMRHQLIEVAFGNLFVFVVVVDFTDLVRQ